VFNKQAEDMLGYTADEMRGRTVAKLHPDIVEARKIWETVNQEGGITNYDITLQHKNGKKIPILISAVSIRDGDGKEIGQAGFMRDLRQVHLLEERLHALIKAGQAIGRLQEVDQILQLIVESAIAAFPAAEKGSIHLYDEKTKNLQIRANYGYSARVVMALVLKTGEGFAGWVYEHGDPIVSGNVWQDYRFKELRYPETKEQKSTICVPLKVKGEVIGTLSLDNLKLYDAFP
jgi:PAS domain S-box-containing protein